MAKYTIELRDIIESDNVELFDFDYEYYADNYALQRRFENLFIQTYYFHEIGFETIERFKWNLKAKLDLNAPMYKQYWESHLKTKNIDFTVNKEYYETVTRELETENESSYNSKSSGDTNSSSSNRVSGQAKSSNIENGVSSAKLGDDYITSIETDLKESTSSDKQTNTSNSENSAKDNGTQKESVTTSGKGNIGTTSSAQLIKEWRQIMLNLDRQIIEDCADLFMQMY